MRRVTTNSWVDAAAFVEMAALAGSGLLIYWRLPAGSGHSATVAGLGRHDWGEVHFWIAVVFLATLATHLALHWKWIASVVAGTDQSRSRRRVALAIAAGMALLAAASAPLLAPVRTLAPTGGAAQRLGHIEDAIELPIDGRTTVGEVAQITGLTLPELAAAIGAEEPILADERLGPLRRRLGLTMSDLRTEIAAATLASRGLAPPARRRGHIRSTVSMPKSPSPRSIVRAVRSQSSSRLSFCSSSSAMRTGHRSKNSE